MAVQVACAADAAPGPARLRAFARAAANGAADITVRIVGGAEARRLNRVYRGTDRATNVLAFACAPRVPRARRTSPNGDIVLCHPLVVREARSQGKTVEAHYAHLVVHAMLHLRGYAHERAREAVRMEKRETAILARLGVSDPYAAR